jgi:hypothetical protein
MSNLGLVVPVRRVTAGGLASPKLVAGCGWEEGTARRVAVGYGVGKDSVAPGGYGARRAGATESTAPQAAKHRALAETEPNELRAEASEQLALSARRRARAVRRGDG